MTQHHWPTLTALRCFEAAARHLSFTRAATELNLTQSAVSKQVAQLEELVQHRLFRRVRQRLQLTPEGALYRSEVHAVLSRVSLSTLRLQSYDSGTEVLNLTTLPTFGGRWLIPRLNGFRFRHPNILLNIDIRVEPFDLEQDQVDVAFFFGHGAWPKAECIKLVDEALVPVCSPLLIDATEPLSPTDLARFVLLQSTTRPAAWQQWFDAQGASTAASYHGPRFDNFDMALRAARVGCGVALVPRFLVQEELEEGKLIIPYDFELHSQDAYYLAYQEHLAEVPKVKAFIDWVMEHRHA